MTRARYRFRDRVFGPDDSTDAEPVRLAMQCLSCGLFSRRSEEPEDGSDWAVAHLREHPGHLDYRAHVTRPYRFVPGEWG
ncbi:hypothetical protein E1265_07345 [Streptomyces sp. 8K308]|uniref:DUF7848 domain-containing protein n=1 Tax=Streptomyces sp. 8K308 TaxID=2530388 RepID=UPI00104392E5|nr:hypothetical protein [Streptomyces sp. 8K308]TDC25276.1 hypothetical protein E1265_07345 [Streptomyces sp. 8K308]